MVPDRVPVEGDMQRRRIAGWTVAAVALWSIVPGTFGRVSADPTPGFVEHWTGTDLHGWGGGDVYSNPGTGGTGGAGDGYLVVSNLSIPQQPNLGTVSFGAEYFGDWIAAGIRSITVWLNDVGVAQSLEIHVSVGNHGNMWQYDQPFVPLHNQWKRFVVDLSGPTGWTQIIGNESFETALGTADRLHLRHDLAPFIQQPDGLFADFGIDQLLLTDQVVQVMPTTWGRIKSI